MRSILEDLGWRQGSILPTQVVNSLISQINTEFTIGSEDLLIVASQSCDIASAKEDYIELSIARVIDAEKFNKQYAHNRSARILHTKINFSDEEIAVCLFAHEKIQIKKSLIGESEPSPKVLFERGIDEYASWLADRYKRPALPTNFDQQLQQSKKKRKKIAEKANDYLLGIYVQIYPNTEIEAGQVYSVNLLGIIETADHREDALQSLKKYADLMSKAGMEVTEPNVFMEEEISLATFRQYQRINFDYLSYEADTPLPPDTSL